MATGRTLVVGVVAPEVAPGTMTCGLWKPLWLYAISTDDAPMRYLPFQRSYTEMFARESVTLRIAADADVGARVVRESEGEPGNFGAQGRRAC